MYLFTSQKYLTKVSVSEAKKPVDYGGLNISQIIDIILTSLWKLPFRHLPEMVKVIVHDKIFLAFPHPGLAIYKNCIELELNLASTGGKTGLPNARNLHMVYWVCVGEWK
ncbi:hypothetical protein ABFS82_06G143900 [Erythranthe guttata]